jgi:hypothetical protein
MKADGQSYSDFVASGGTAVQATPDGSYFTDLGWPVYAAGTYQVLLKAAGNGLGAYLNMSVVNATGSTLLSGESHNLTSGYTFVATKPFAITSNQSLVMRVNSTVPANSTFMIGAAVLVDKIAIVRLKNATNQPVGPPSGAFSDPMDNDTDFDGLKDGNESTPARGWYEAEVLAPTAPEYGSPLASSGQSVIHPIGTPLVLNAVAYGYSAHAGANYQLYVRAISLTGASTNVMLQLSGMGPPAVGTVKAGTNWSWLGGPVLAAGAGPGLLTVTAADADDSNYNDSGGFVAIDEVAIFDTGSLSNQAGWFNATSPLDPDADRDGLDDGSELDGFFAADIIQAENYTSASSVAPYRFGIVFNNSAASANYSFEVRYGGEYRFLIEPLLELTDGAGAIPYDTVKDLLIADVRDAAQAPVGAITLGLSAFQYTNQSTNTNGWNQVGSFYDGRFNLSVGNYSVKLTINLTKAGQLHTNGRDFRIYFDQFYLQKYRLNATNWDVDGDLVPDGYEVNRSMLPLRGDSDYDSLGDLEEIQPGADGYITSPVSNDTDHDGVLDSVEVGGQGDADNSTRTDPTNLDTDGDGLPDGWVDGWTWNASSKSYGYSRLAEDGIRQPWEGEDLNGNGAVNTSAFALGNNSESVGGETDPNLRDTDNDTMNDGWEVIPRTSGGTPQTLNPRTDDAWGDAENDALYNFEEYRAGTDPFVSDTDSDGIRDGEEARVFFRTDVTAGAVNTSGYPQAVGGDWAYYDINPYDGVNGKRFGFHNASKNLTADSGLAPNRTKWIKLLDDGGLIAYNATLDEIVVWARDSDPFDANHDGILGGTAYEFTRNESVAAEMSPRAAQFYGGRELVGPVDPTKADTDGDNITDGKEGYTVECSTPCGWSVDYDGDGLVAAADVDSDNDGLPDGSEDKNGDGSLDPSAGETAPFAADTDGDGIPDGTDALPLDQDNDGLTGYQYHDSSNPYWRVQEFYGKERCPGRDGNTSYTNPDTDGDGIPDGLEDANHNCVVDSNETDPLNVDTDDDGLWDGALIRHEAGNVTPPVQSFVSGWSQSVVNATLGGAPTILFQVPPWYLDEVTAAYDLSNLTQGQYLVTVRMTEVSTPTNTTRLLHVRLDGKAWWETRVTLNTSAPNWTTVVLGHALVPAAGEHNLTIASDTGGFYIASISLTPVNLSEGWFGTNPRHPDTDGDGLRAAERTTRAGGSPALAKALLAM